MVFFPAHPAIICVPVGNHIKKPHTLHILYKRYGGGLSLCRLEGQTVIVARGDAARVLAQRTVLSARRVLPGFTDITSAPAVRRCAHLLRDSLGEPSYIVHRTVDGPVEVWVVSLKNSNGLLAFELWLHTEMPRFYIFTDRPSPVVARLLKKLRRSLYGSTVTVLSEVKRG